MTDTKYNGWTNYATWRIALELFDGSSYELSEDQLKMDLTDLSYDLKNYVEDVLELYGDNLTLDYALAFISDVNFYEIAENLKEVVES